MKVAVSTDGGEVSAHFGRCPQFTIAVIEAGKIVKKEVLENPGHDPGRIPKFLKDRGVECIVAGGMGMRAQQFFAEMEIQTLMGITGPVDEVIEKIAGGSIEGGESLCKPGAGKGYGVEKNECDHEGDEH